jgi:seryl-tRNA synthetase
VHAVDLVVPDHAGPAELDGLARKLRFVAANDVLAQRPVEPKVIWRGSAGGDGRGGDGCSGDGSGGDGSGGARDVFGELLDRGIATEAGDGQVAVGEPVLSLMDYLDARLRELSRAEFGAVEYRYPTVIPAAVLRRCGYFESFPQLLMFVARLHGDLDTYRQFIGEMSEATNGRSLSDVLRSHGDHFDYCLPPTMCFHTYHQLAGRPLPAPSAVITSRGKSFRFESRYQRSLERLWDFTIREIVFIGSRDFVLDARSRLMNRTFELAGELGVGGHCEVATDPFFVNADTAQRVWSQQFLELKYELRLPLEPGRDVAVCSFNFHERFFAESFAITAAGGAAGGSAAGGNASAGEEVYTACAGYGLERFAYAFLCRHGLDPRGWPEQVRKAVPW